MSRGPCPETATALGLTPSTPVHHYCPEVILMSEAPVMFTPAQICRMFQISRSKTYEMLASGEIPSVKFGRSRRIPYDRLQEYLDALRA